MHSIGPQNAVAAIRVSSVKQGTEGDSPEAQREQIERFAANKNIRIKKFFRFLESASKETQPMQEAIDYCKNPKNGVQLLIVKSIDRFTRGGSYSYSFLKMQLEQHDVRLIDIYGIIGTQKVNTLEHLGFSYKWSVYDPTKNSEILEAERASDEKRDIMSRMIGAEIRYTQLGYWMRRAPYGYVSEKVETRNGKRTVLRPHPIESPFIVKMYELRYRGTMSDSEIVSRLNKLGYKSRVRFIRSKVDRSKIIGETGGNQLTVKAYQKIITNPIYAGVNTEKWTNGQATKLRFNGLVSIEVFNGANRGKVAISDNGRGITHTDSVSHEPPKRTKKSTNYPYRRIVMCPVCNMPFHGSASRGRNGKYYEAYHCNRNGHPTFRVPKKQFDQTVTKFARSIKVSPEHAKTVLIAVEQEWDRRHESQRKDAILRETKIKDIDMQIRSTVNNLRFMRSETAINYAEEDIARLDEELKLLKAEQEEYLANELANASELAAKAKVFLANLEELLLNGPDPEARGVCFGLLFDTSPTYKELEDAVRGNSSSPSVRLSALFRAN